MLTDVSTRDLTRTVLNTELPAPFLLAPIGVQGIIHEEGEVAVARAAAEHGIPMILSTVSSFTLEKVADTLGATPRWFQLYWPNDEAFAKSLLQRAADAGYEAIVVTVDTRFLAWRPRDLEGAYLPFLKGEGLANYTTDPVFCSTLEKSPEEDIFPAILKWTQLFPYPSTTWEQLDFIRSNTDLPIVLKGILHPDDARRTVEAGMDGIIVSNHGGRQVDGSIATLDALPGVVKAVPEDFPVLFDSGIRTGADVFKAIALGASAVLLGRPYVWALGLGGTEAVTQLLRGFLADVDLTLALSGFTSFDQDLRSALQSP
jgi:isopentenyl diphosphate isomerase/L-lactate dehydrogenase-like FMN-dependent dehydrogenase